MSHHMVLILVSAALLNPPAHAREHGLAHTGRHIHTPTTRTARGISRPPPDHALLHTTLYDALHNAF